MRRMRVIPTTMHGALDYAVALLLILSPWIFRFSDVLGAKWTAIGVGIGMALSATTTNYELGLVHIVPMHVHLLTDLLVGAFLAASPWIVGFSDRGPNAWVPMLVIGILEVQTAAMSSPWPRRIELRRQEEDMFRHAARA
jgi:hypothetical protein